MRLSPLLAGALFVFGLSGASAAAAPRKGAVAHDRTVPQRAQFAALRELLQAPEIRIDLAKAKVAIDRFIDPELDAGTTLQRLDTLAATIKARFPANATGETQLELLVASLSQPGPWNDSRPFSYDLDDPFGENIHNKLLSAYLASRKGNCVSMPILLVILGQKLGLDITLATAPEHYLAKFRNDQGEWVNIEATSFGTKRDASYQQELGISPEAMANGIYLRPLNKRESVAVMMGTLMEFYGQQNQQDRRIEIADLALEIDPKDVQAMLQKGNAYFRMMQQRYVTKYFSPAEIPSAQRRDFETLQRNNELWFARAEALGWTMPTQVQRADYLQTIQRAKAIQQEEH